MNKVESIFSIKRSSVRLKRKLSINEIISVGMVALTLLPTYLGGCSKDVPKNSAQPLPAPKPSASEFYMSTETPSISATPAIIVTSEPSTTPTATSVQMSIEDEIVMATIAMCDQLYLYLDENSYTGYLGQYTTALAELGRKIKPQSFKKDPKKYNEIFILTKMFLALKTPEGGDYGKEDMSLDPIFDTIIEAFDNEDDKIIFEFFISRGKIIAESNGSNVDRVAQELFDGMCNIYDKVPVDVGYNRQIDFNSTSPMCQCFLNYYLYCVGTLLEDKTEDGTIKLVQDDNHNLKNIVKTADDLQIECEGKFREDVAGFSYSTDELDENVNNKLNATKPLQYQK